METEAQSDIQSQKIKDLQALDWVGMQRVQSSLRHNENFIPCELAIGVSLIEGHRGIHMSRLYSLMMDKFLSRELTSQGLENFLAEAIASQSDLATEASLNIVYKLPVRTQALKSAKVGYRNYDVAVSAVKAIQQKLKFWLKFEVIYSSTCPQSAALSVEKLKSQDLKVVETFERLPATPHAQRSVMVCELFFEKNDDGNLNEVLNSFIQAVENTLKTPVQTAVKKADEMAFAVLNSENLMFCEDAVRKVDTELKSHLSKSLGGLMGYRIRTRHEESLHPHDATSQLQRSFQMHPFW